MVSILVEAAIRPPDASRDGEIDAIDSMALGIALAAVSALLVRAPPELVVPAVNTERLPAVL